MVINGERQAKCIRPEQAQKGKHVRFTHRVGEKKRTKHGSDEKITDHYTTKDSETRKDTEYRCGNFPIACKMVFNIYCDKQPYLGRNLFLWKFCGIIAK